MTGLLRDLMHERADAVPAPDLDVAAMVRDGRRRVTRRRTELAGAGAAGVLAVALVVPSLGGSAPETAGDAWAAALVDGQPVWAVGSRVYVAGGGSIDTGHEVRTLVQTDRGVVLVGRDGVVRAADGARTVEVGLTDDPEPRLETDGERVAWVEETDGEPPAIALYDISSGEVLRDPTDGTPRAPTGSDPGVEVFAVDGDDVYLGAGGGTVRWDVSTDTHTSLDLGFATAVSVDDVKAGVIAYPSPQAPEHEGPVDYWLRDVADLRALANTLPVPTTSTSVLSPRATYLLGTYADGRTTVYDVETGRATAVLHPSYDYLRGYAWVNEDTFLARGHSFDDTVPVDLLRCDVDGACEVAADDVGALADGLVPAIGEPAR